MKKWLREEGQGLVEFALVVPILITILCGILDFGWIYSQKYLVEHAAFEGARYAAVYADDVDEGAVNDKVHAILSGCSVTTTVSGGEVAVTVKKEVPILTYVASTYFGPTYTASSTVKAAID